MITLVIKCGKVIGVQDAFSPLEHITHGLAVIVISDFIVYGYVVLIICGGLNIIGYFCNVITYDHLPAIRIRG
ncbi:hypothetical protein ES705_30476 [subsurface metagenome]